MEMDLKKFKEDYDKYSYEQKKETVITMLQALLWKWENFDKIYNFIINNPEQVFENELDQVFVILLLGLYENQQEKLKEIELKLNVVIDKMKQLREQERKEKEEDDAEKFLNNALLSI